jgi:hypothetical protein
MSTPPFPIRATPTSASLPALTRPEPSGPPLPGLLPAKVRPDRQTDRQTDRQPMEHMQEQRGHNPRQRSQSEHWNDDPANGCQTGTAFTVLHAKQGRAHPGWFQPRMAQRTILTVLGRGAMDSGSAAYSPGSEGSAEIRFFGSHSSSLETCRPGGQRALP